MRFVTMASIEASRTFARSACTATLGEHTLAATSVVTLTIPANTFEQAADVVLASRSYADPLPGQPTALDFAQIWLPLING